MESGDEGSFEIWTPCTNLESIAKKLISSHECKMLPQRYVTWHASHMESFALLTHDDVCWSTHKMTKNFISYFHFRKTMFLEVLVEILDPWYYSIYICIGFFLLYLWFVYILCLKTRHAFYISPYICGCSINENHIEFHTINTFIVSEQRSP